MTGQFATKTQPFDPLRAKRAMARCPHCEAPARIRTSVEQTILYREFWMICTNVDCGHSWKAALSFVHTISRASRERPGLHLPLTPTAKPRVDGTDTPPTIATPANDTG